MSLNKEKLESKLPWGWDLYDFEEIEDDETKEQEKDPEILKLIEERVKL